MELRETPSPVAAWKPLLVAVVGTAVLMGVGWLVSRDVQDVTDEIRAQGAITKAKDNMSNLLKLSLDRGGNRGRIPVGGKAYVLWMLLRAGIAVDAPGSLEVFWSPADPNVQPPIEEYRALTEERLLAGADVRHLTSYVGPRRDPDGSWPQGGPLIADLHFPGGALVGYLPGTVEWLTREQLGLGPNDPIVAGPESRSPILRQLSE